METWFASVLLDVDPESSALKELVEVEVVEATGVLLEPFEAVVPEPLKPESVWLMLMS
jgi:hypothetical protein